MKEIYKEKLVGRVFVRESKNDINDETNTQLYYISNILKYNLSDSDFWMSVYHLEENKNIKKFTIFSHIEFEGLIQLKTLFYGKSSVRLLPE